MEEIYELQADVCKIFANAKRLEIIKHSERRGNIGQRVD